MKKQHTTIILNIIKDKEITKLPHNKLFYSPRIFHYLSIPISIHQF